MPLSAKELAELHTQAAEHTPYALDTGLGEDGYEYGDTWEVPEALFDEANRVEVMAEPSDLEWLQALVDKANATPALLAMLDTYTALTHACRAIVESRGDRDSCEYVDAGSLAAMAEALEGLPR